MPDAPDAPATPATPAASDTSAALATLIDVMDRLRSPGGCPWDARQTHESLMEYTLEEAYELVEAVELGDRAGIREELGDVLLQVVFNARVAQEHPDDPFDLADVARDLTAKLVRRHPHVFADDTYVDDARLRASWDAIKQQEKARASVLDGIPPGLGALARAQKVLARAQRAGLTPASDAPRGPVPDDAPRGPAPDDAPRGPVPDDAPRGPAPDDARRGLVPDDAPRGPAPDSAQRGLVADGAGRATASDSTSGTGVEVPDEMRRAEAMGAALLDLVRRAQADGIDAEGALRGALRRVEAEVVASERRVAGGESAARR